MYRSADQAVPADTVDLTTSTDEPTGSVEGAASDTVLAAHAAEEADTVVVHVALRPRRGSARRCSCALGLTHLHGPATGELSDPADERVAGRAPSSNTGKNCRS